MEGIIELKKHYDDPPTGHGFDLLALLGLGGALASGVIPAAYVGGAVAGGAGVVGHMMGGGFNKHLLHGQKAH